MTVRKPIARQGLHVAAVIAAGGALIHVAAIAGGPSWFEFFGAPPAVVASARAGTWLAPVSSLAIAGLMALCAAYALSALGRVRRLPLLRLGLFAIASVCLLRTLALPLAALRWPQLIDSFELVAAAVWGAAGLGFVMGCWDLGRQRPGLQPSHMAAGISAGNSAGVSAPSCDTSGP
ncbi:hypothetical protein [Kinneretia aquatilis]|uniref:hypothetical protein n=1 Tax=Kinneretia aquatilis TaxID=2070761 RepID=UPI0014952DA1|nr:hypothetical protein [Paucibacter aquatile]WIV99065.1 hypothetical protein K9V56_006145 [Paucibacter aquatile]